MDSMVEENGSVNSGQDPLASPESNNTIPIVSSVQSSSQQQHHLVAATNIVHLTLPNQTQAQVQSVIQPNQQSVIQTAANIQPMLSKGNVILVSSKPNSVIHTTAGSLQTIQVVETGSDESYSDEDSPKKRRDLLTRRPSYRKILNDLGGGEIAEGKVESSSECDSNLDSEVSSHSLPSHYQTVIPAGTFQVASQGEGVQGLHTITMTNATAGGAIVQYGQGQDGQQFFVPGGALAGGSVMDEDQTRKREMRLLKNREAARECRRKKKEYIKCLENRVAVLETQNKALIDELKSLKELYCQQKTD
ncbi:cyclic AMP-responsive element-binding protein 1 isoform X2 [Chrysoperla carnea]|uniref:cyclic AMP-responsive element-binding protein 1 isoform X2 n=1 Tax=Chrysoperla carnea TaxID=189513 RepID=UPI001D082154|nr:cyclic AMP-responsive element-binding protein 1 isoform X2 [Chrysoperla carnea]